MSLWAQRCNISRPFLTVMDGDRPGLLVKLRLWTTISSVQKLKASFDFTVNNVTQRKKTIFVSESILLSM